MGFRAAHLRYFVVAAEEGQITRAAATLGMAQPALSQAIAALESEIGFPVFERQARGVTLTPAGVAFLAKAREALAAEREAVLTGEALARAAGGTIEFGFVGAPPGLDSPRPFARFEEVHPGIDIRYRELPFPTASPSKWLSQVDLTVCHWLPPDEKLWTRVLRSEPRVVLAPRTHPLAERSEVSVEDLMDQTFVGYSSQVDPVWAGFWSLDDHRGGPPQSVTPDDASVPQEIFAGLAVREAITTVPASSAAVLVNFLAGIVAIPIIDADPTTFVIAGHRGQSSGPLDALVEMLVEAAQIAGGDAVPRKLA
jgi:DNA-binding transcriptional LysR family regulator